MCKRVTCPNCAGSGQAGEIPLLNGKRKPATCVICNGECDVPEWDYIRLKKLSVNNEQPCQLILRFEDTLSSAYINHPRAES